ncbi:lipase 3-like [Amyelois transitella]|uniref:lipase 3-like n=1 Tax=Amyelois transitella TaxID=680683 RepID=UPI00067E5E42|nr:lipase 3-like [Amyelois transitella]
MKTSCVKMLILNFLFIIFGIQRICHACTPLDNKYDNIEDDVDKYKMLVEPLQSVLPVYDEETVPNLEKLYQQFQLGKKNEDVHLNMTQLITKYGYPVETHHVTTPDKYCLTMFRIPKPNAPVVFLMHGVLCSSDDWIVNGPRLGLGYVLSDLGYDVWFGNARGNKHSRRNLDVPPACGEFWHFSFDEIGRYDIPAMIDYTLETTGRNKLAYIGHSQGTTAFYVMASVKPEYNDKISIMITLSAVVFMSHVRSPLFQLIAPFLGDFSVIAKSIGAYEVEPRDAVVDAVTSTFCGSPETAEMCCNFGVFSLAGFNYAQANCSVLPVIFSHYPSGSSVRQCIHYSQEVVSGKFRNYDHGEENNLVIYGTSEPPDYPLHNVTCPVALFYSNNDWLTSATDIETFLQHVPNVVEFYHVPCASFNHFDYLYAKDADIYVNREVKRILKKYVCE